MCFLKKMFLTQVRQNTVECLREIADYMDEISRKAGVAKVKFLRKGKTLFLQVVGSGGGVLAGGLTLAGGLMTVMTAGAALPVLVAVRLSIDIDLNWVKGASGSVSYEDLSKRDVMVPIQ